MPGFNRKGTGAMPDPNEPDQNNQPSDDDDDGNAPDLGDAGKRALAEERTARKQAERAAQAASRELAALRESTASESEKAILKAREEGKNEALKTANERLLKAEIKAAAAGKLADPTDAVRLLDADDFTDDTGEVDPKKLNKAIDGLLKDKPYLAGKGLKPAGDGGNGPRGGDPSGSWFAQAIRAGRR